MQIRAVLEKGWNAKTSYCLDGYDGRVKSLGQCYVTARALHHLFGWEIIYSGEDGNNHYWNRLSSGLEVDFTSDQIGGDGIYPMHDLFGKPRRFRDLKDCKTINPRLKRFLAAVEPALTALMQTELRGDCAEGNRSGVSVSPDVETKDVHSLPQ